MPLPSSAGTSSGINAFDLFKDSIVTPTRIGFSELNHKLVKLHVFVFSLKVGYNPDLVIQGQRIGINQEFDAATPNAKRYVVPASGERFCVGDFRRTLRVAKFCPGRD